MIDTPAHVEAMARVLAEQDGHEPDLGPNAAAWYRGEAFEVIRRLAVAGWGLTRPDEIGAQ